LQPGTIVKKYFHSLHEREIKRQDLKISPEDQYHVFKNVVKMLIQFDQSAEKRDFIREIIVSENHEILQRALLLYPGDQNIDSIADKLINHALLDRKGSEGDLVGFINDFVFGTFVGEIMSETDVAEINRLFSPYMIELGITAYKVQSKENKHALWQKIEPLYPKFDNAVTFYFDLLLKGQLERNFSDTIFSAINAYNVKFADKLISSSVFINCKFKNCDFSADVFDSVSFISCHFEDCAMIDGGFLDKGFNIYTIKCTQTRSEILDFSSKTTESAFSGSEQFQIAVLKEIYEIEKTIKTQRVIFLMKRHAKAEQKRIAKAIESLETMGLIRVIGTDMFIEINRLGAVKKLIDSI
jgi:hypothetical protein